MQQYVFVCNIQGIIVKAATSYTSYKELWQDALVLDQVSDSKAPN